MDTIFVYGLLEKDYHEYINCTIKENDHVYYIIDKDKNLVDTLLKMDYERIECNKFKEKR